MYKKVRTSTLLLSFQLTQAKFGLLLRHADFWISLIDLPWFLFKVDNIEDGNVDLCLDACKLLSQECAKLALHLNIILMTLASIQYQGFVMKWRTWFVWVCCPLGVFFFLCFLWVLLDPDENLLCFIVPLCSFLLWINLSKVVLCDWLRERERERKAHKDLHVFTSPAPPGSSEQLIWFYSKNRSQDVKHEYDSLNVLRVVYYLDSKLSLLSAVLEFIRSSMVTYLLTK